MVDKTGQRFGLLVVVSCAMRDAEAWARCQCDCGRITEVRTQLLGKTTRSCGCLRRELARQRAVSSPAPGLTHGEGTKGKVTAEYRAWHAMIYRCENPTYPKYHRYGGRGIEVSPEWRHDFEAFLAHVGRRPSTKHSLDRYPDPDGHYAPGNVRWATALEQRHNRGRGVQP